MYTPVGISTPEVTAVADDIQRALTNELTAQGFEVEIQDTKRLGADRYVVYLLRGCRAKGYFGRIEIEALQRAAAGVEKDFA